ncbi:AbrB family transcriptional regulator [Pseudoroseomonas globiformis]|uniref:AbrB family transcriptional regulator n=1 Tax=Teichococcus globiformis TaxID=2307229 RepID=A0ABV7FYJ2_9PROT
MRLDLPPAHALPRAALPFLLCTALAALGGWVFQRLGTPLPWLLGALFFAAAARLSGLPVRASRRLRNGGLMVLGCALGLFFTPHAAGRLAEQMPLVLGAGLATLAIGVALSPLLARTARVDRVTALFASIPGGVAEMSVLGESYGARPTTVAIVQLLRVVGVVVLVPSAFAALEIAGTMPSAAVAAPFQPAGFALLAGTAAALALLLTRLGVRNGWMLGGLASGLAFTASGMALTGVPGWITASAQILMGAQLGSQFERAALLGGGRLLGAAILQVAVLTGICCAVGAALAWCLGLDIASLVLANAPGGMAEMSLTAKALLLDVPMVVAFHLVRIALTAVLVQPCTAWMRRSGWL